MADASAAGTRSQVRYVRMFPGLRWLGDTGATSRWEAMFLFLSASLASTIRLKVAGVQYMELLYLAQIAVLLARFRNDGFRVTMLRPLRWMALFYGLFLVGALVLAVHALGYQFYFLEPDLPLLRRPLWITMARSVELLGNAGMMLYLAESFRRSRTKLRFALRTYFWTGVASCGFALMSVPVLLATHLEFGAYKTEFLRLRGFYNEGGPFGLYLVNLFIVGSALYLNGWETRRRIYACWAVIAVTFVGASSKAAIIAIVAVFLINALVAGSVRQQVAILGGAVGFMLLIAHFVNISEAIALYQQQTALYERASLTHRGDLNFVEGRVAGSFIVPRMIAAHPLAGVGWGNYGNLRNAPEYRGASAWSDFADDPGLGLYGLTADIGIPLMALLLACLTMPFWLLRARRVPSYVLNLALILPISHLFGAQLNTTYSWVVAAFALGFGYASRSEVVDSSPNRGTAPRPPDTRLVVA